MPRPNRASSVTSTLTVADRFRGMLLGTAVGDSVGLPAEGISPRRARKLFGDRWRQRLVLNRGMVSDDTEHTLFVAQSLLVHPTSSERFARRLAWCLRLWLMSLPAGVGLATLRAIVRLWLGFKPTRSGVRSAGNGPAMRSALIGAFFATQPDRMDDYLTAATTITHTDPRALTGAKAVAYLAAWTIREDPEHPPPLAAVLELLRAAGPHDEEWLTLLASIADAHDQRQSVEAFADRLGLGRGVTGYAYHTVPVVIYAWLRHFGDFEETLSAVLNCGGDTDTTGAIVGALAGGVVGHQGIPGRWVERLADWPRGSRLLTAVAARLADTAQDGRPARPVHYFWPAVIPRNLLFLVIVLLHGLRRLAPPY